LWSRTEKLSNYLWEWNLIPGTWDERGAKAARLHALWMIHRFTRSGNSGEVAIS